MVNQYTFRERETLLRLSPPFWMELEQILTLLRVNLHNKYSKMLCFNKCKVSRKLNHHPMFCLHHTGNQILYFANISFDTELPFTKLGSCKIFQFWHLASHSVLKAKTIFLLQKKDQICIVYIFIRFLQIKQLLIMYSTLYIMYHKKL